MSVQPSLRARYYSRMERDPFNLQRFVDAQDGVFATALAELEAGAKRSHWMWFVFPQFAGLGQSELSRIYAIRSLDEARAFVRHPVVGPRYRRAVEAILGWAGKRDAAAILGSVDSLKLRSSLTLFAVAACDDPLFTRALRAFYFVPDPETLRLITEASR